MPEYVTINTVPVPIRSGGIREYARAGEKVRQYDLSMRSSEQPTLKRVWGFECPGMSWTEWDTVVRPQLEKVAMVALGGYSVGRAAVAAHNVTVAAGGAAIGATVVPVNALAQRVSAGQLLTFTGGKLARTTASAAAGAVSLAVEPLAAALVAGNVAPVAATTVWVDGFVEIASRPDEPNGDTDVVHGASFVFHEA